MSQSDDSRVSLPAAAAAAAATIFSSAAAAPAHHAALTKIPLLARIMRFSCNSAKDPFLFSHVHSAWRETIVDFGVGELLFVSLVRPSKRTYVNLAYEQFWLDAARLLAFHDDDDDDDDDNDSAAAATRGAQRPCSLLCGMLMKAIDAENSAALAEFKHLLAVTASSSASSEVEIPLHRKASQIGMLHIAYRNCSIRGGDSEWFSGAGASPDPQRTARIASCRSDSSSLLAGKPHCEVELELDEEQWIADKKRFVEDTSGQQTSILLRFGAYVTQHKFADNVVVIRGRIDFSHMPSCLRLFRMELLPQTQICTQEQDIGELGRCCPLLEVLDLFRTRTRDPDFSFANLGINFPNLTHGFLGRCALHSKDDRVSLVVRDLPRKLEKLFLFGNRELRGTVDFSGDDLPPNLVLLNMMECPLTKVIGAKNKIVQQGGKIDFCAYELLDRMFDAEEAPAFVAVAENASHYDS